MGAATANLKARARSASISGSFAAPSGSEEGCFPISNALRPLRSHQTASHHVEISERAGHEESMRVLRDAPIAHLGEAEDALDHADGVFHSGAYARARPVDDALARLEVLVAAPALLSEVLCRRGQGFDHLALPGVSAIA